MSIEVRSKDIIVIDILKFIIQVEWTVKKHNNKYRAGSHYFTVESQFTN